MTGVNSSYMWELRCSGFEIYGSLALENPMRMLMSQHWYVRRWAIETMVHAVKAQQDSLELRSQIHDVEAALKELDQFYGLECTTFPDEVVRLCDDLDVDVRMLALSVLPELVSKGNQGALKVGFKKLTDPDPMVSEAALLLLETVASPGDRDLFLTALDLIFQHMKVTQGRRGSLRFDDQGSGSSSPLPKNSRSQSPAMSLKDSLIPPMPHDRPYRRSERNLELVGPNKDESSSSIAVLVRGLALIAGDTDGETLKQVLSAHSARHGRRRWQECLLPHTSNTQWYIRSCIARTLPFVAKRGDQEAVTASLALLADEEVIIRRQAADALKLLAGRGDVDLLKKMQVHLGDPDDEVRTVVARAIGDCTGLDPVGLAHDTIQLAESVSSDTRMGVKDVDTDTEGKNPAPPPLPRGLT